MWWVGRAGLQASTLQPTCLWLQVLLDSSAMAAPLPPGNGSLVHTSKPCAHDADPWPVGAWWGLGLCCTLLLQQAAACRLARSNTAAPGRPPPLIVTHG